VETAAVSEPAPGTLYVVSTPIGNLGDLSARATGVLRGCDVVLAEDTRRTRILLKHFAANTRIESVREHNEARATPRILSRLLAGGTAALVSDAGTPLVSDPGARLVTAAIVAGIRVVAIPGPSALLAALVTSGLPAEPFTFFGFVPRRAGDRTRLLGTLSTLPHTAVCYESPERVAETLTGWDQAGLGSRPCAVARELTKRFEEIRRGTVHELAAYYESHPPRGEIVLVLGGAAAAPLDEAGLSALAQRWRSEGVPARDVARRLSEDHGAPRNLAYRLAHSE
jgi:16S rRNA (cytidine1402-2'-O)-methyltransferase